MPPRSSLWLAASLLGCACSSPGYEGTVVVGQNYVQALVTAPADQACPPRVQRPGMCVRTPTAPGSCSDSPACVTGLIAKDETGRELGSAAGPYARATSLLAIRGPLEIDLNGCGGRLRHTLAIGAPVKPFSTAAARVTPTSIELSWTASDPADLVCALWTGPGAREVCCASDEGTLSIALQPKDRVEAVFLSRGRLLERQTTATGVIEYYRTAETGSLLD